jgi:CBS domain-containing protein
MIPAAKVATCLPTDTAKTALDDMVSMKIGAIIVVSPNNPNQAVGILTKTDFVEAYQKGLSLDTPIAEIMSGNLQTLKCNQSRDQAAEFFENNKNHHAVVIDDKDHFVGIVSAWDVSAECAKDGKAWPWNRSEDGRFHKPSETPGSPTSVRQRRDSHTFLEYIDSVRNFPFMDD